MINQEINDRLREAGRSLGFANTAVANNDIGKALSEPAEVCLDIAAVCAALNRPEIASRLRDAVRRTSPQLTRWRTTTGMPVDRWSWRLRRKRLTGWKRSIGLQKVSPAGAGSAAGGLRGLGRPS
jgi:hypothetical protein